MNRRLIIILISVSVVAIIAAGVLFYAVRKQKQPQNESKGPLQTKKVLDEVVISPIGAFDNNSIWYFNSEGRLFRSNVLGSNLSEYSLPSLPQKGNLKYALWPKQGSDFISFSSENGSTSKTYFDHKNKVFMTLASNVQWLDWMPDGKRVVYIWQSADKKTQQLVLANADGSGYTKIADVFWPDLAVKAGNDGKTVLMYRTNIVGDTNKIYAVNLLDGQISTLVDSGKNTSAKWLPSGNQFLFTHSSDSSASEVYLFDLARGRSADLGINTSLDKVAVDASGSKLYAAVPKVDNSSDTFIDIDLKNIKSESYFEPSDNISVKNIILLGNTVYYIDGKDNKLYMIDS